MWYCSQQGTRDISIDNTTATFDTSTIPKAGAVLYAESHEHQMMADLLSELKPDDVFIDIGANIGIFSCIAALILTEGTVAAVEPFSSNIKALRRNAEINEISFDIVESALSNVDGFVDFTPTSDDVSGVASIRSGDSLNAGIRSARGDNLIERGVLPQPNVVKIDVEGAEPLVLEGMKESLSEDTCRLVYCEVHHPSTIRPSSLDFGASLETLIEEFTSIGFDVSTLEERDTETQLKAVKPHIS